MKRKGISQYKLLKRGIDHRTLNTLKHGGNITMRTLENICRILDCEAGEVVAFVEDNCVMERVKTGTARSAAAQNDQEGSSGIEEIFLIMYLRGYFRQNLIRFDECKSTKPCHSSE